MVGRSEYGAIVAVGLLVSGVSVSVRAQALDPVTYPESFATPLPLFAEGLGPFSRPVTTASPEAQAYFDQGMQMMYAFNLEPAARSFREAQRRDPTCAMCYWGEAWAWGPYLNGAMGPEQAPRAYAAIQRAQYLAAHHAVPRERALIEAMAVRYTPEHDPATRRQLDTAYVRAMAAVHAAYPTDLDAGTLYAEALFLLEPRRGTRDIEQPAIQRLHAVLEGVLARDLTHPGACHLYVHATESTVRPDKAAACAEHLGTAIPGASHINHMPSHTWNVIGRWGDAVRANLAAWHSDLRAAQGIGFAPYAPGYRYHNLHMLLFAASMDGQGAIAIQAAKDYAKLVDGGDFFRSLTLVRFGRFDEVLDLTAEPTAVIYRGLWAFGRGYAYLRTGAADSARIYLDRVRRDAAYAADSIRFRGHTGADLLGIVGGILAGEVARERGDLGGAVAAFESAVALEDGLRWDEPEPLNFSARDWLGAVLLHDEQFVRAEQVYREAAADHPHNGWALFGLERALRGQGREAEAGMVHEEWRAAWARADTWITASRF